MDAATAGHHRLRSSDRLQLQLPRPKTLIPLWRWRSQWMFNSRTGFWIRDWGREDLKNAKRSGSASNAECEAGHSTMRSVFLWRFCGCCCATTACTRHGGWCRHLQSLCSRRGHSHALSNPCHTRFDKPRWGGAVLTRDCRVHGTPSLRAIPHTSLCGNASLSRANLGILPGPRLLLFQNDSFGRSIARFRALGRHRPIPMFNLEDLGIISPACICNGRRGRLLSERPGRYSKTQGGEVYTALHSNITIALDDIRGQDALKSIQ